MELFTFSSRVGMGLPLWLPRGSVMRYELESFLRKKQKEYGYLPVVTPHIGSKDLYVTSGHYAKYGKDSFQPIHTPQEGEEYMLKPMNCPHHCEIFRSSPRSYKDLPLRLAEFGTVYRYEQSGELRQEGFQFCRSRVLTFAEVHKSSFVPESRPLFHRGFQCLVIFKRLGFHPVLSCMIGSAECEHIPLCREHERTILLFLQGSISLPSQCDEIGGGIDGVSDGRPLFVVAHNLSMVSVLFLPVGSIIGMISCGVGQTNNDLCLPFLQEGRLDACEEPIFLRQTGGGHLHLLVGSGIV